jgi:HPt (histidine-containing phosphotransfer) domain-containing protein
MTASVMQADRDRCFASGMDDFVTKPLEVARLRQVLERWGGQAAPPAPVDATVLDDLRALQEEGEPSLLGELIDLFLADLPERCAAIRDGVIAKEPIAIRAAAHSLKGSAGNLGARSLATLCQEIEMLVYGGSLDGAAALVGRLDVEAARVQAYLETVPR